MKSAAASAIPLAALLLSCSPSADRTGPRTPTGSLDPTPLARCRVGGGAANPIVTEWDALKKARLETLLKSQPVLVRYTGCELELVDQCRPPGAYVWTRTTLATDTLHIRSEDELYAKLPIGAVALQGELAESGELAVRTRVAGQLRLADANAGRIPLTAQCSEATHLVSAVSLGTFKLLRGKDSAPGGSVDVRGAGLKGASRQSEQILHEAGTDAACINATPEAADPNCASPLQLFLVPLDTGRIEARPPQLGASAVHITFPQTESESWALYDAGDELLCTLPCERWVPPKSGYVLKSPDDRVDVPDELPFTPGERAVASYRPQRGSPTTSAWLFWGIGAWSIFPGVAGLALGISEAASDPPACNETSDAFCGEEEGDAAFLIVGGSLYLGLFGASLYYYLSSKEQSFSLSAPNASARRTTGSAGGSSVQVGPGFVRGTF